MSRLRAATLAVGTEVTDGQILDRNSALLSKKVSGFGFDVVEHRAVPDNHALIDRALREMTTHQSQPLHVLFVTGGLGPTSDDFTRDVLSNFFKRELEYDSGSWAQIEERLNARGIPAREIQKQQCYFPRGAHILFNPAGTANGFMFGGEKDQGTRIIALPGPPAEIEAIWDHSLKALLQDLVPVESREELLVWQCLGRGESEIAELVEPSIAGTGLRVGYRVHLPYVEVKLWVPQDRGARLAAEPAMTKLRAALKPWTVGEGNDDPAVDFLLSKEASGLRIIDVATQGLLSERLMATMAEKKIKAPKDFEIRTLWELGSASNTRTTRTAFEACAGTSATLLIQADSDAQIWRLAWAMAGTTSEEAHKTVQWHTIEPTHKIPVESERGRKFIVERALLWVKSLNS